MFQSTYFYAHFGVSHKKNVKMRIKKGKYTIEKDTIFI